MKKSKLILLSIIIIIAFLLGFIFGRQNDFLIQNKELVIKSDPKTIQFISTPRNKPKIEIFTSSSCETCDKVEKNLREITKTFDHQIEWQPHYVFQKKENANLENCVTSDTRTSYCSPNGRNELNQNLREICAWQIDSQKYYHFITSINNNCKKTNFNLCWQEQAQKAGYTPHEILNCFNEKSLVILKQETNLTKNLAVNNYPILLINNQFYPPAQKITNQVRINQTTFPDAFSLPALRHLICNSFEIQPEQCRKTN